MPIRTSKSAPRFQQCAAQFRSKFSAPLGLVAHAPSTNFGTSPPSLPRALQKSKERETLEKICFKAAAGSSDNTPGSWPWLFESASRWSTADAACAHRAVGAGGRGVRWDLLPTSRGAPPSHSSSAERLKGSEHPLTHSIHPKKPIPQKPPKKCWVERGVYKNFHQAHKTRDTPRTHLWDDIPALDRKVPSHRAQTKLGLRAILDFRRCGAVGSFFSKIPSTFFSAKILVALEEKMKITRLKFEESKQMRLCTTSVQQQINHRTHKCQILHEMLLKKKQYPRHPSKASKTSGVCVFKSPVCGGFPALSEMKSTQLLNLTKNYLWPATTQPPEEKKENMWGKMQWIVFIKSFDP